MEEDDNGVNDNNNHLDAMEPGEAVLLVDAAPKRKTHNLYRYRHH